MQIASQLLPPMHGTFGEGGERNRFCINAGMELAKITLQFVNVRHRLVVRSLRLTNAAKRLLNLHVEGAPDEVRHCASPSMLEKAHIAYVSSLKIRRALRIARPSQRPQCRDGLLLRR
jgi:hypothetical protein